MLSKNWNNQMENGSPSTIRADIYARNATDEITRA